VGWDILQSDTFPCQLISSTFILRPDQHLSIGKGKDKATKLVSLDFVIFVSVCKANEILLVCLAYVDATRSERICDLCSIQRAVSVRVKIIKQLG
jgi:hypothetical protein